MRSSIPLLLLAGVLPSLSACGHAPRRSQDPPAGVAVYSRHARFVDVKISPQGTYLAVASVEDGVRSLAFVNLATRQSTTRLSLSRGAMAGDYRWVNDQRVAVQLVTQEGDLAAPVSLGEVLAVDAEGKNARIVFGFGSGRGEGPAAEWDEARARDSLLGRMRGDDRTVLVEATSWEDLGDRRERIWAVDAYQGNRSELVRSPMAGAAFLLDEDGVPRIAHGRDPDMKRHTFHREPDQDWRELSGLDPDAEPVGFVARDRILYVSGPTEGGFGLYALGLDGGGKQLLAKNDVAPPSGLVRDRLTGRVAAVEFQPDLPIYEFVEPEHPLSRLLKGLLAAHPEEHVVLVDTTDDQKKAVVRVYGDRSPGRFLLADVDGMTAEPIVEERPWIRPAEMAETTAFHVPASDGLRIHGYLTSPPARPGAGPPPMVVYPHGGPHSVRDGWGFDPMVQFLASEGFAVLQVNYRGSGGYGEAYQASGYRRWGDRMIEDIVDATRFAVRKGYADPGRICTLGASFGAYAAVKGTILAPELFRCAIGYAGVYDLTRLRAEGGSTPEARVFWRAVLGEDERALEQMSPVHDARRIRARVLLVHGAQDRRAPLADARRLRKALKKSGNHPGWLVEEGEGHGFHDEAARERMFARVLAFLRESLGPTPPR